MARNIEIKAAVVDRPGLEAKVRTIATQGPTLIQQDDTFFQCDAGRLKLRQFGPGSGELIFYVRDNLAGPKASHYVRSATTNPDSLREALQLAYGTIGRVVKSRTLYLVGRTRVHLDEVTDLGHYMELEVVLEESEALGVGVAEADALIATLGIAKEHLVEGAYLDLLRQKSSRHHN